jgi:hypothetical protein
MDLLNVGQPIVIQCSRLGLLHYEDRVRNLPVVANRRRGNPGKGKSALEYQPSEIVESVFSGSESEQTSKKSTKKGPKSKKDTEISSDSEESDFDIFAHSSPNRKAKNTTKTPTTSTTTTAASKSKTTKKVATKKVTTSKETPTPANIKTRANSKQGAKGSGFVPRK